MAFSEQDWKKAKKLCRLNEEDIRIAKEMGLNPRSLIKNICNNYQQLRDPKNSMGCFAYFSSLQVFNI
jgi:hypothetical protein